MITSYFFPIGTFSGAPVSFPIQSPNLDTARAVYDAMVSGGFIAASARP